MKLFVTDYDDTLFTNEKAIKITNKKLRKLKEKDYLIVIATGRSYPSIKNQTKIYNILYDFIICADGSVIYNNDDHIIKMHKMNLDIVDPFIDFYQNVDFEEIQFTYPEGYSNILNRNRNDLLGTNICVSNEKYTNELVYSFNEMSKLYPDYSFLNYRHPNYSYLCIKPKGVSKSFSIEYLRKKYHILKKDVHVIGDASNDYEMIRDFNGVCISKSTLEILAITKKHYKSIDYYINDLLQED